MTTLCLDFGNTRQKAVIFVNEELVKEFDLTENTEAQLESTLNTYQPDISILSSVIHHNEAIESLLIQRTTFHKVSSSTKLNFTIGVNKPNTIGADRLALMAAAAHYFNRSNTLVVSMGTCITYNFINQFGEFLGGAISPGMNLRFKAMHDFTDQLPLVKFEPNIPLIGYNTPTNLQSGVIFGILNEIEGFIEKYDQKYSNFNVVLTGGHSPYFASQLKSGIFADANFLFKGLKVLSEINH